MIKIWSKSLIFHFVWGISTPRYYVPSPLMHTNTLTRSGMLLLHSWRSQTILPSCGELKGPCLVLVIEWQLRWTSKRLCLDTQVISPHKDISMSNMCHEGEMTKCWCYSHIVWWRNSFHMRHDIVLWLDGEDRDKALRWWTGCKCEGNVGGFEETNRMWRGSLNKDLAPMD